MLHFILLISFRKSFNRPKNTKNTRNSYSIRKYDQELTIRSSPLINPPLEAYSPRGSPLYQARARRNSPANYLALISQPYNFPAISSARLDVPRCPVKSMIIGRGRKICDTGAIRGGLTITVCGGFDGRLRVIRSTQIRS